MRNEAPPPPPGGFEPQPLENALRTADRQDLALVCAGILALIFSVVPWWYSASFRGSSDHTNAWHGFFPWFGALLAVAGGVFVALIVLNALPQLPVNAYLVTTGFFGLAAVLLLVSLFTSPYVSQLQDLCHGVGRSCSRSDLETLGFDFGTGVLLWLTFLLVLAATVIAAFRFAKTRS